MIKINRITPETVEVFDPQDNSMGKVNENEFNDLRLQISQQKAVGYKVKGTSSGTLIPITPQGQPENWESGMFDMNMTQIAEIFKAQKKG